MEASLDISPPGTGDSTGKNCTMDETNKIEEGKIGAPAADSALVTSIPSTPINEAIHNILSTAENNTVAIHLLGNSLSKLLGKYTYRDQLRGRKLLDYLISQEWLSISEDKSVVTLLPIISLEFTPLTHDNSSDVVLTDDKEARIASEEKIVEHREKKTSKKSLKEINKTGDIFINCPHCDNIIVVAKRAIRCGIFRHGVFKSNGRPIKPHGSQEYSEDLLQKDQIYGCGQPFRICKEKSTQVWTYTAEECGWI